MYSAALGARREYRPATMKHRQAFAVPRRKFKIRFNYGIFRQTFVDSARESVQAISGSSGNDDGTGIRSQPFLLCVVKQINFVPHVKTRPRSDVEGFEHGVDGLVM
jgi:hypothetical protein